MKFMSVICPKPFSTLQWSRSWLVRYCDRNMWHKYNVNILNAYIGMCLIIIIRFYTT